MTEREVKEKLRAYRPTKCAREAAEQRLSDLRAEMESLPPIVYGGAHAALRTGMSPTERLVERLETQESKYIAKIKRYTLILDETERLIDCVDDTDGQTILRRHYLLGERFEDIPARLHLSERTMWSKYDCAIKHIAKNCSDLQ